MRTAQERVAAMHQRARQLRCRRANAALAQLGALCVVLLIGLTTLALDMGRPHTGVSPGQYMGSTMLFESAGGYVLVALAAFAVGVIVTAVLIRRRKRENLGNTTSKSGNMGGDDQ